MRASKPHRVPGYEKNPPPHLSTAAHRLWRSVTGDYELDPGTSPSSPRCWRPGPRADEVRRRLDDEGLTVDGGFGPRVHPLWGEITALARRGLISWADMNASTSRRIIALNCGVDPYAHLRVTGDWTDPYRHRSLIARLSRRPFRH
jgi:hypothetical protein